MSIGKLTHAAWQRGDIVQPTDLQSWQDNINGVLGPSVNGFQLRTDFIGRIASALTTTGTIDQFLFSTMINSSLNLDNAAPDSNTMGYLSMSNTGAAAPSVAATTGRFNIGTADFWFAARIKFTGDLSKFQNSGGFEVGINSVAYGVYCGNASGGQPNWTYLKPSGGSQDSGVAVNTANWIVFELMRVSGTLTYTIDGAHSYSTADATSITQSALFIQVASAAGFANAEYARIDYMGFMAGRPTSG